MLLRTSGHISLKGSASPFNLGGNANLEIPDFAVLDRAYDARKGAPQRMFEMGRTRLTTGISLDPSRIALPGALLDVDGSRVAVDGALHFDLSRGLDLAATSDSITLAALRGHVGALTWDGTVVGLKGHVFGQYGSETYHERAGDPNLPDTTGGGRGYYRNISLINIVKLARALGVDAADLVA